MKNLVILFVVFFSLFLTSCSDVTDNSMLTNPVMEKSVNTGTLVTPSPKYPYPYLFNFTQVGGVKYSSTELFNSVQFYLADFEQSPFSQLYVVVTFSNDKSSRTYFIDEIELNTFKIDGINAREIAEVEVFGYKANPFGEATTYPTNNTELNSIQLNSWSLFQGNIQMDCSQFPTSLKYVFAEITTKQLKYFVFLQKPFSNKFVIPNYGKLEVENVRLYGLHTLTESEFAVN